MDDDPQEVSPFRRNVGALLRHARMARGIPLDQLAPTLQHTMTWINRGEHGQTRMNLDQLEAWALALGVGPRLLLHDLTGLKAPSVSLHAARGVDRFRSVAERVADVLPPDVCDSLTEELELYLESAATFQAAIQLEDQGREIGQQRQAQDLTGPGEPPEPLPAPLVPKERDQAEVPKVPEVLEVPPQKRSKLDAFVDLIAQLLPSLSEYDRRWVDRVLIYDLWSHARTQGHRKAAGPTLTSFRKRLLRAHKAGGLVLLPATEDDGLDASTRATSITGTFHFLKLSTD